MKRFALLLTAIFLTFSGFAQNQPKFTEDDAKQFYRTMQGDYVMQVNDSTTAMVHFTPIWESKGNRFQWMYVEATIDKNVVFQKVLEVQPKSSTKFRVYLHDLKNPVLPPSRLSSMLSSPPPVPLSSRSSRLSRRPLVLD